MLPFMENVQVYVFVCYYGVVKSKQKKQVDASMCVQSKFVSTAHTGIYHFGWVDAVSLCSSTVKGYGLHFFPVKAHTQI